MSEHRRNPKGITTAHSVTRIISCQEMCCARQEGRLMAKQASGGWEGADRGVARAVGWMLEACWHVSGA